MYSLLALLMFVIFIACVGFLLTEGMWSNAVRLVNVVTAALLATNFWEPLADWLEGYLPSFTYLWDFLSLWILFVIFMVIFRTATDYLSRVKVRFLKIADRIGSVFFAAWIGLVMVCFTTFSLHTAPLARNFLRGSFVPETRQHATLAPDLLWMGFAQKVSRGQFCRALTKQDLRDFSKPERAALKKDLTRTFDPCGQFMVKYATRRARLEKHFAATSSLRVRQEHFDEHAVKE